MGQEHVPLNGGDAGQVGNLGFQKVRQKDRVLGLKVLNIGLFMCRKQ